MSENWTITTKEGIVFTIEEWIGEEENRIKNQEFSKLQKEEVIKQRRCLKKRTMKDWTLPEYNKEHSEVRQLTDEEIKEYIMPEQEKKEEKMEEKSKPYKILFLLKKLGGRGVLATVIANGIKEKGRAVSSILSQMRAAGILSSCESPSNRRLHLWRINEEKSWMSVEKMVKEYNGYIRENRKKHRDEKKKGEDKEKMANVEIKFIERGEEEEETCKSVELGKEVSKLLEQTIQIPSTGTLKIVVEGSIKILFGLAD